jgi:hypothetical protein
MKMCRKYSFLADFQSSFFKEVFCSKKKAYVKYIYHGSNNMVSEAKNCQTTGNFSFLQPDHWTSDKKI